MPKYTEADISSAINAVLNGVSFERQHVTTVFPGKP